MIANIVTGSSFAGCAEYAYGKDEAEVIAFKDIIPDNHNHGKRRTEEISSASRTDAAC